MNSKIKHNILILTLSWIITAIGLILMKYIPMSIYGEYILFDASSHMAWSIFGLYFIWIFLIESKKEFRIPYIIISTIALIIMAIQRIISHNHNALGVTLGIIIGILAIIIPRFNEIDMK